MKELCGILFSTILFLQLSATAQANLTRGPYLQKLTPNSITIRWRTDMHCASKVQYGINTSFEFSAEDTIPKTEHIIQLNNLMSSTKYLYSINNEWQMLQGDANNYFFTSPAEGNLSPIRFWVTGDFGNGSEEQKLVRDAFKNYSSTQPTNFWIWLGDNAYGMGLDSEYQQNVFDVYPEQFKNIPLYPAPGNHDYAQSGYMSGNSLGYNFAYFNIFTVPTNGEAGGEPSYTAKYYSYNYGNAHFISLDSYGSFNDTASAMYKWLERDLQSNKQKWTVVYFHHPPYTKGSHNSDWEIELIDMRNHIVPLLEKYGVDLVLSGHSHNNERSYLMHKHYGNANTFTNNMKVSNNTNNFVKTPPYNGTIYAVCGTSGQWTGFVQADYPMPCMYFNNSIDNCSMIIDINDDKLTAKYLTQTGSIADEFSIIKKKRRSDESLLLGYMQVYYQSESNSILLEYELQKRRNCFSIAVKCSRAGGFVFSDFEKHQTEGNHQYTLPMPQKINSKGVYFCS
ncbi:MAG: metallophosphoesterase [Bacteroidetes bacterium]|nr:metallophosphoesterase [Bacteroidota bacterium]